MHVFKKLIHRDNGGKTVGEISCSEAAEFRMRFPLSTAGMGQKQLLLTETSSGFTRCANDPGIAVGHGDRILTLQVFQPLLGSVHEENYDLAPVTLTESADFLLLFLLWEIWTSESIHIHMNRLDFWEHSEYNWHLQKVIAWFCSEVSEGVAECTLSLLVWTIVSLLQPWFTESYSRCPWDSQDSQSMLFTCHPL